VRGAYRGRSVGQIQAEIQGKARARISARLSGDDRAVRSLDRDLNGDRNHFGLWDEKRETLVYEVAR